MKVLEDLLMSASLENEDYLLDVPFCAEEGYLCLWSHGSISWKIESDFGESDSALRKWIEQICNAITDLECVPDFFKIGIIIPVYKGEAKTPLTLTATGESCLLQCWPKL